MKRIGVLTGGGDCPGLNAVIRAVVKSAILTHNIEVVGIKDGYQGLIENNVISLREQDVSGILTRGGTILGTSNKANPFNFYSEPKDRSKDCLNTLEKNKIEGLVVIGGDGTQASALKFSQMGFPVVSVPKTIDNDLSATDVTFGFDSALNVATEAVDRLHTTGESHKRVMVLEVMGRYAGWIALRSGIAGGGDVILIPEIPYEMDSVCDAVKARVRRGKKFSIIVVAEGAKPMGGDQVVREVVKDSPDPVRLGGVGELVAHQVRLCSGLESRVTVLGHLQRGGPPTPFDRWLATRFGAQAVHLLVNKKWGQMVSLRGQRIQSAALEDAVNQLKLVEPNSEEVKAAKAVGTSFGEKIS